MKKLFVLLAMLTALSCAFTAYADGAVIYNGDAGGFIFTPGTEYSPSDLFPDFKNVMPGDTLTQSITVRNDASKNVKVKIYLRSLGAHEDSYDFLSQLKLRVKKSEDNDMAYMFDAEASESAQLTDSVCLGTLYSGGIVNLELELVVPPELDNAYADKIGYIDWEFATEDFPVEESDPDIPQTGDDSKIILFAIIAGISGISLIILILTGRKKRKDN